MEVWNFRKGPIGMRCLDRFRNNLKRLFASKRLIFSKAIGENATNHASVEKFKSLCESMGFCSGFKKNWNLQIAAEPFGWKYTGSLDPGTPKNQFSFRNQNETRNSTVWLTKRLATVVFFARRHGSRPSPDRRPSRQKYFGWRRFVFLTKKCSATNILFRAPWSKSPHCCDEKQQKKQTQNTTGSCFRQTSF